MVAAACTQSREIQMQSGAWHICQVAGLRRVCNVRLNIKAPDQESQENLDKEQNMERARWFKNSSPSTGVRGWALYWG